MSALAITPAGILTGIAVAVVLIALVGSVVVWWTLRRSKARRDRDDGPVIDLAYLEQAIKADEDATARRAAEDRPLLSESPSAQPHRPHRLPTDEY